MATNAYSGLGTTLSINTTGSTYAAVGEVVDASLSGKANKMVDVTHLGSPGYDEFIAVIKTGGSISVTLNRSPGFTDAGQAALQAKWDSAERTGFKLTLPAGEGQDTGDLYGFSAIVEQFNDMDVAPEKPNQVKASLRISGAITFTAGTASS